MTHKRLYAIVLLAALALLQVRLAFAACEVTAHAAAGNAAICCDGQGSAGNSSGAMDDMAASCVEHCIQAYTAHAADESAILVAQPFAPAPPFLASVDPPADARLHSSFAAAHSAHTRLIYVLQRLLI